MAYVETPRRPGESAGPASGAIKIEMSLMHRALQNEPAAVSLMFQQFLSQDEAVKHAEYLGMEGMFGLGIHSFGAVTDRRVASIRIGPYGHMIYHDGFLEYVNSTAIHQPSKLGLYFSCAFFFLLLFSVGMCLLFVAQNALVGIVILSFLLGLVGIYWGVRSWYGVTKCGLVFHIKEGIPVHLFTNCNKLAIANRLYRTLSDLRDARLNQVSHSF